MSTDQSNSETVVIRITESHLAQAFARCHDHAGNTDQAWEEWQQLPQDDRSRHRQVCRSDLLHRVNLNQIWEQAIMADVLMQKHQEELDIKPAHLEDPGTAVYGTPTLACALSKNMSDWYIPINPVNQNVIPNGTWEDWVSLAQAITAEDTRRIEQREPPPPQAPLPQQAPLPDTQGLGAPLLVATTSDIALAMFQFSNRNSTAGEAMDTWKSLPREHRERIVALAQNTATLMFDWERLLDDSVKSLLSQDNTSHRNPVDPPPLIIYGGGCRLAITRSRETLGTYQPHSPRNGDEFAEGEWDHWTELAREILQHDRDYRQPQPA